MQEAYLLVKVDVYHINDKKYLVNEPKYYAPDIGFLLSIVNKKIYGKGFIFETCVANELIKHGFKINVGKFTRQESDMNGKFSLKRYEVDFVVEKNDVLSYIQVCYSLAPYESNDSLIEPLEREIKPFKLIKDNHRKIILTYSKIGSDYITEDGIEIISFEN